MLTVTQEVKIECDGFPEMVFERVELLSRNRQHGRSRRPVLEPCAVESRVVQGEDMQDIGEGLARLDASMRTVRGVGARVWPSDYVVYEPETLGGRDGLVQITARAWLRSGGTDTVKPVR
jgi:hypothetical protein